MEPYVARRITGAASRVRERRDCPVSSRQRDTVAAVLALHRDEESLVDTAAADHPHHRDDEDEDRDLRFEKREAGREQMLAWNLSWADRPDGIAKKSHGRPTSRRKESSEEGRACPSS